MADLPGSARLQLVDGVPLLRPEEQVFEALSVAHNSELPLRLHGREVLVKTGEIWPRVYHEAALVDRRLAVAVCAEPAALPGEVAAVADRVIRASLDRG